MNVIKINGVLFTLEERTCRLLDELCEKFEFAFQQNTPLQCILDEMVYLVEQILTNLVQSAAGEHASFQKNAVLTYLTLNDHWEIAHDLIEQYRPSTFEPIADKFWPGSH